MRCVWRYCKVAPPSSIDIEIHCLLSPRSLLLAMAVRLTILGSGSAGNCAYVETAETRLLVDAGLSARQIRKRLASIGRAPENLSGILITHEHSDHIQGLGALAEKLQIPVYCNRPTQEVIQRQLNLRIACRLFATGVSFEIGDVLVENLLPCLFDRALRVVGGHDDHDLFAFDHRRSGGSTLPGHRIRMSEPAIRIASAKEVSQIRFG